MRVLIIALAAFGLAYAGQTPKISDILTPKSVIDERDISKLEDPFFGQKSVSKSKKGFLSEPQKPFVKLEAIFEKTAMINGKWLKEGENIDGYKLLDVDKNKVTVSGYGEQMILNLFFIKGDNEAR